MHLYQSRQKSLHRPCIHHKHLRFPGLGYKPVQLVVKSRHQEIHIPQLPTTNKQIASNSSGWRVISPGFSGFPHQECLLQREQKYEVLPKARPSRLPLEWHNFLSLLDWCMPRLWNCQTAPWWANHADRQTNAEERIKLPEVPGHWRNSSVASTTMFLEPTGRTDRGGVLQNTSPDLKLASVANSFQIIGRKEFLSSSICMEPFQSPPNLRSQVHSKTAEVCPTPTWYWVVIFCS